MVAVGERRSRSAPLDGFRALLATSVVLTHCFGWVGATDVPRWQFLLIGLQDAVPAFFALSGFLLAVPFLRALEHGVRPEVRTFAVRRALRILPAYWVVLLLGLLLLGSDVVPGIDRHTLWKHLLLQQNWSLDTLYGGIGSAWSLVIEVQFYVFLPLLFLALDRLTPVRWDPITVVLVTCGVLAVVGCGLRASELSPLPSLRWTTMLLGQLQWFALGIALAALRERHGRAGPRRGLLAFLLRHPVASAGLSAAAFCVTQLWFGPRRTITFDPYLPLSWPLQLITHDVLLAIPVGLLLSLVVFLPDGELRDPVRRAFAFGPWARLGLWTYSVYLIHEPVRNALHDALAPSRGSEFPNWLGSSTLTLFVLAMAITVPLAALSYRLLEAPFMGASAPGTSRIPRLLRAPPLRAAARRRA